MKLLTDGLIKRFAKIGSQEKVADPIVICKFFDPTGSWSWYATEFDGNDTFFGLVDGFEKELGYFSLSELEHAKNGQSGILTLPIERDLYFKEQPLSQAKGER